MSIIAEAEQLALSLPASERAKLAEKLLVSLPSPFVDNDDGIDEAIKRSKAMDEDPNLSLSEDEFDQMILERFPECVSG